MLASQPASVAQVTQAAAATIKTGPGELVGIVVISSTAGTITVYDNTAASGTQLIALTALTAGQVVTFGGVGMQTKNGLHAVVGGTATVNVLWR